ncbi:unnamed protein product [Prunus armeniaca]|uniref:Uncharacterized protein n=1 Tax=Prunus armeniaca TaxID=36596 RepID=A0A6J5X7K6_PRUAR|nr:unnamed protein product [Prunus armeniaca]
MGSWGLGLWVVGSWGLKGGGHEECREKGRGKMKIAGVGWVLWVMGSWGLGSWGSQGGGHGECREKREGGRRKLQVGYGFVGAGVLGSCHGEREREREQLVFKMGLWILTPKSQL